MICSILNFFNIPFLMEKFDRFGVTILSIFLIFVDINYFCYWIRMTPFPKIFCYGQWVTQVLLVFCFLTLMQRRLYVLCLWTTNKFFLFGLQTCSTSFSSQTADFCLFYIKNFKLIKRNRLLKFPEWYKKKCRYTYNIKTFVSKISAKVILENPESLPC